MGARGYVMKEAPLQAVVEALRRVVSGRIAVSDEILSQMII
jgi:DNA-binding NarL/FixJ family response regulator